jgi:hypothetical protein
MVAVSMGFDAEQAPLATISRAGDEYVVGVPGLGVAFRGADLSETYARALRAHADAERVGLVTPRAGAVARIVAFSLRAAVLALVVVVALEGLVSWTLRQALAPDPNGLRLALGRVADELEAMRPESKEQLRGAIGRIAAQLRPYLSELQKAVPDSKQPAGQ